MHSCQTAFALRFYRPASGDFGRTLHGAWPAGIGFGWCTGHALDLKSRAMAKRP